MGAVRPQMDPHEPAWADCMHRAWWHEDFPPRLGHNPEITFLHHRGLFFAPCSLECVSNCPTLPCFLLSGVLLHHPCSILPIAMGGPVLAALTCRLCGTDLIWRNCGRSIRKPTGKWEFLYSLAGAQATYPSPAAPGHSSLGHQLPWSMCASHPKYSSPRRQFISSALERGVTVPNYLPVQRFLVSHFPLTVLLWKYFLLWALSFVFLCGFYRRGSSVLAPKQLQWETGFRQNTQLPLRRQTEKCQLFHKGTSCSVPAPQPPFPQCLFFSWSPQLQQWQVPLCSSALPMIFGTAGLWALSLMELLSATPPNYSFLSAACTEPCQ